MPTKVCLVKAMVFPIVMNGCESWTIRKAECRRIDAFELWCWRRLLRVPLDCKEIQLVHPKGNQSWVFIGRIDVEAETPILWPADVKSWLTGKDPDAGKIGGRRRRGRQRMRWLDGITDSMHRVWADSGRWWRTGKPGVPQSMGSQRVRQRLSDWTIAQVKKKKKLYIEDIIEGNGFHAPWSYLRDNYWVSVENWV